MKLKIFKLRERIFKRIFQGYDFFVNAKKIINSFSLFIFTISTILFFGLLIFSIGFSKHEKAIDDSFEHLLKILFLSKVLIEFTKFKLKTWELSLVNGLILAGVFTIILIKFYVNDSPNAFLHILLSDKSIIFCSFLLIITEVYHLSDFFNKLNLSPSVLFALSFLTIIFFGSGLLMLPSATSMPISYLEALFTSASAVCVTGLVVVDTNTIFTPLGKSIILILIQIGGLGIMAFTGFFGYIFTGSASLKERMLLKDIFSGERLSDMFKLLGKIILLTLIIEALGTLLIYYSLGDQWNDKLSSSVFHAVSAFCNAGFSTFPEGLANPLIRHNTFLQLTISFLVILGGIGFPVLFYFYNRIKHKGLNLVVGITKGKRKTEQYPFFVGQKIALRATILLLVLGTVFYFLFEKNNSLSGLSTTHQFVTAFFGSASARTAGFNVIDINLWGYPTVFLMLFLMWVGASPGSTGGGIKTTTFALALKTAFGFCRGQRHIEIGNRELGLPTILKVVAIITFSIIIIFCSTVLLLIFDPAKSPTGLLFESISAFSTVGLSLVNTASLSINSKIVLILLMYIGRIGPILLLTGLLRNKPNNFYRMPIENLAIN